MGEFTSYTPITYLFPEVISVCQGREVATEGCVHLLSLILGSLVALCYANGNTKENRARGFGFTYQSKTSWLADLGKRKHRYGCFSVFRNTL